LSAAATFNLKTVEFHKAALARELNLNSFADFTRSALEHRIIAAERFF
jgi:hypothetical protein